VAFIKANDKKAYNQLNDVQLKAHLIEASFSGQIRFIYSAPPFAITSVATWEVRHEDRAVHLIGIVGTKDFMYIMLNEWKAKYPFYALSYYRNGVLKRRHNQQNFNQN